MQKKYLQFTVKFNDLNSELIYNRLYLNNINSILEDNESITFYVDEENSVLADKIKSDLINLDNIPPELISVALFKNLDWNEQWQNSIEPVFIANKLVIYPSWKKNLLPLNNNLIRIEINPKMSFGTGHNDTTKMILEQMCSYINPIIDKFMLDFGSGTGILSIAAAKLGISKIIALEIDDNAVRDLNENILINNTTPSITCYQSNISEISETDFDVIAANITSNVIQENFNHIYKKLKNNGKLFVTGILKEETAYFISFITNFNFLIKELKQSDIWSAIYAIKTQ
jgi:ribosomal protein L11 methyltransferase